MEPIGTQRVTKWTGRPKCIKKQWVSRNLFWGGSSFRSGFDEGGRVLARSGVCPECELFTVALSTFLANCDTAQYEQNSWWQRASADTRAAAANARASELRHRGYVYSQSQLKWPAACRLQRDLQGKGQQTKVTNILWLQFRTPNHTTLVPTCSQDGDTMQQNQSDIDVNNSGWTTCWTLEVLAHRIRPRLRQNFNKTNERQHRTKFKTNHNETLNCMLTWHQHVVNIDAQTYQNPMPKQVAKQILGIVSHHVFFDIS